jgi:hypothetical protein
MAVSVRTPKQEWSDYLYRQVEVVNTQGANKRMRCIKRSHNYSGSITRISEHLKGTSGDVKACTFSQTRDEREVLDELHSLEYALPKGKKRKAVEPAKQAESNSRLKQVPIENAMLAAGSLGVDQACADWVYETGIPFNVFR